jgi:predicted DCC family thiol-disulfide oxidoreductase YuxK
MLSLGGKVSRVASANGPILLFDGVCNLCNRAVQWVIARDRRARFRFAALQSEAGRALLARLGLPADSLDTVVLVDGEAHFTKSDAALEVARRLGGAWALAVLLKAVPRPLRDAAYDWVARRRYARWGRRAECWVPTPELRARFL